MATKVHMEALSPTMEEGQIVKWLKSEGDAVKSGEILAEVETDKAVMELVARGDGILRKILLGEGKAAPVGEVIGVIAAEDEDISEFAGGDSDDGSAGKGDDEADDARTKEKSEKEAVAKDSKKSPAEEADEGSDSEDVSTSAGGRVKASPVARKLADAEGVDLSGVSGSGPGGRIVKRDVEEAAKAGPVASPRRKAAARPDEEYEDVPLSQMRKTIARRLVESIGPIPHFFLTVDVDMTRAVEARERVNALLGKDGGKVSLNDIVLKATAMALHKHPECNAHWQGDSIRRFHSVHLGVAVAIEDGLITPVVRHAHRKGLAEINAEVRELAGRAREKKLSPDEYTGATFSVSNLGMFGIEEFTAVINPPEAGILAVGAVEERPVVVDGDLEIRSRMKITMSCDHRVIDGAQGSRFLQTLKAILEEPLVALM